MQYTMSDLVTVSGPLSGADPAPPVRRIQIEWEYLIERRPIVLAHAQELPPYLLLPEVHRFLDTVLNEKYRLLCDLMWHTGARISEALKVTPRDFYLDNRFNSFVSLLTLKQGVTGKKKKTKSKKAKPPRRMVPLTDEDFMLRIKQYIHTQKIKRDDLLFDVSRQSALTAVERWAAKVSPKLPIAVTPHTFRHSFGVNMVLHNHRLNLIANWMGHSSTESTEIYTKVLGAETNHIMVHTEF